MNGAGGGGGRNPQPPNSSSQTQKFELERFLLEQQAKLRSLEQEQSSGSEFNDYREKLRLLQVRLCRSLFSSSVCFVSFVYIVKVGK